MSRLRRTRANNGTRPPQNGPVSERKRDPKTTWTLPEARELVDQGYSPAQVEKLTNLPRRGFENGTRRRRSTAD